MKNNISIRFYEELNDFLGPQQRKQEFNVAFKGGASVRELIESLGVPPAEVDLILANGVSVPFSYAPRNGDRISVYPVFEAFDISTVTRLRDQPLRRPKFILDSDLDELAKMLRIFGFDALHSHDYSNHTIVDLSLTQNRTILTKSKDLLLTKGVVRGYRLKHAAPERQFNEVIHHFDLQLSQQLERLARR